MKTRKYCKTNLRSFKKAEYWEIPAIKENKPKYKKTKFANIMTIGLIILGFVLIYVTAGIIASII